MVCPFTAGIETGKPKMTSELCMDSALVEEIVVEMAEKLDVLGYPAVLEDIETAGALYDAVHDIRFTPQLRFLESYLKELADELLKEEKTAQGAEQVNVQEAKKALQQCWKDLKECIS